MRFGVYDAYVDPDGTALQVRRMSDSSSLARKILPGDLKQASNSRQVSPHAPARAAHPTVSGEAQRLEQAQP